MVVTHVSGLRVVAGVCPLCSSDSCIEVKSGWRGVSLCSSDSCIEVKSGWRGVFVV